MATKLWHLPLRVSTGAFILDQGMSKREVDEGTATWLRDQASRVLPQFKEMEPAAFAKLLSTSEMALGAALLAVPVVPPLLAGLGLLAFSLSLNRLYLRTPGATRDEEGVAAVAPSREGVPLAKDSWMTAIAAALVLDSLTSPRRHR
jgi:hypothetical protein